MAASVPFNLYFLPNTFTLEAFSGPLTFIMGAQTVDSPRSQNTLPPVQSKKIGPIYESGNILEPWDGPVWDSRYGRFESQEDVAADDRKGKSFL